MLLVTAERPDRVPPAAAAPGLASAYPAALLVPHSVELDGESGQLAALAVSRTVFEAIHRRLPELVRRQWHYELFRAEPPRPRYLDLQRDVEPLGPGVSPAPAWAGAVGPGDWRGWRFRALFAEYPDYLARLVAAFEGAGGRIRRRRVAGPRELAGLPGDARVVCAGLGSPGLLGRSEERHVEAGWLVHLSIGREELGGEPVSYNVHPGAAAHPGPGGGMDLYAYPRRRDLVLGATRLPGVLPPEEDERAQIATYPGERLVVPGHHGRPRHVPRPIVDLNLAILERLYNLDLTLRSRVATIGWRYRGASPGAGPTRVETTLGGRPLLACYALGGAGVTLSWGLAAELARRLVGERVPPEAGELGEQVGELLARTERTRGSRGRGGAAGALETG